MFVIERGKIMWLDFVKALANAQIEFPHLKSAILAQSILETGRGTSKVFLECKNPAGMKWRPEMQNIATAKYIQTVSEPSGGAEFCNFATFDDAVVGYFRFLDRSPYAGWRNVANKTAADFLEFIGKIWCPPGYTVAWIKSHNNMNYHQYIIHSFYKEAEELLINAIPKSSLKDVSWFEFNLNKEKRPVIVGYAGSEPKFLLSTNNVQEIIRTFEEFPNAKTFAVAPVGKSVPNIPEYNRGEEPKPLPPNPSLPKPTGKKVLLDPGHSDKKPGARGKNPAIKEEVLNRYQAQLLKKNLEDLGIRADIIDPPDDNLYQIGLSSRGYDAFISLHLNSFSGKEHYTCTMCHAIKQSPNSKSAKVASKAAQAIAKSINNKLFSGTKNWPVGVMAASLGVLSGAVDARCPVAILTEAEFIDDEVEETGIRARLVKAMQALAKVIAEEI